MLLAKEEHFRMEFSRPFFNIYYVYYFFYDDKMQDSIFAEAALVYGLPSKVKEFKQKFTKFLQPYKLVKICYF